VPPTIVVILRGDVAARGSSKLFRARLLVVLQMIREDVVQIFNAAEQIDRAANIAEMMRRLRDNLGQFGFATCMVTNLPHPKAPRWQEHILINEWPRDWYDRYISKGHYRHDPCVALSRTATGPFVWSDIARRAMAEEACQVMDEAREFGLHDGICIPVETDGLEPAVVTLAGRELDLAPMARCAVHALAKHAYQAAIRLVTGEKEHLQRLSRREREILQWIAEGKTAWEISRILTISENTVNTHMRNMRQKLNTSNTVHTVTEALRRGEITL
jgi:LuxR family quorum sensing-dependent transcriptional regulator